MHHPFCSQDTQDCIHIAQGLVDRSLLRRAGSNEYRIHDLLLDFVGDHIKPDLRKSVASRQAQYLAKFGVVRRYATEGILAGFYALMALWRPLELLQPRVQVEVYKKQLPAGEESEDAAFFYWAVARLLELQVGPGSAFGFWCIAGFIVWRNVGLWIVERTMGTLG